MKVLIACEESQAVTIEFRKLGHEAYSCDIEPCSGGHPEWHLQQDVAEVLKEKWDMIIAFPPCTHLAVSGAAWFKEKIADGRQQQGIDFFMQFTDLDCEKVVIENPICIMSTKWRKPDQIINPFQFGDPTPKKTSLWVKGLPLLKPTNIVEPEYIIGKKDGKRYSKIHYMGEGKTKGERSKLRSKTFPGIARAMAEQWGGEAPQKQIKEKTLSNEEDTSREQEIVDQTAKMKVLNDIKAVLDHEIKGPLTLDGEQISTVAEYMLYLENQVASHAVGIDKPPSIMSKDWVQKDIQIIMRDSGIDKFLEDAQIINLSGRVLVHRSERAFIKCILDESPENMKFTLIEEVPRTQKKVTSATTGERNITITFDDGSSQSVPITKEETSEDWD